MGQYFMEHEQSILYSVFLCMHLCVSMSKCVCVHLNVCAYICVCVHMYIWVCVCICGGGEVRGLSRVGCLLPLCLSPSTLWVPEIKLRMSGLVVIAITC